MTYQASRSDILWLALKNKTATYFAELQYGQFIYCKGVTELIMEYLSFAYTFDSEVSQQQYIDSADHGRNAYAVEIPLNDFLFGIDQYYFDLCNAPFVFSGATSIFLSPSLKKIMVPLIREAVKRLNPTLTNNYKTPVGIDYIAEKAVIEKGKYNSTHSLLNGFSLMDSGF